MWQYLLSLQLPSEVCAYVQCDRSWTRLTQLVQSGFNSPWKSLQGFLKSQPLKSNLLCWTIFQLKLLSSVNSKVITKNWLGSWKADLQARSCEMFASSTSPLSAFPEWFLHNLNLLNLQFSSHSEYYMVTRSTSLGPSDNGLLNFITHSNSCKTALPTLLDIPKLVIGKVCVHSSPVLSKNFIINFTKSVFRLFLYQNNFQVEGKSRALLFKRFFILENIHHMQTAALRQSTVMARCSYKIYSL